MILLIVYQEPGFGDVTFGMIGDDSAVNFFRIEPNSGLIITRLSDFINSGKDVYVVSERHLVFQ